MVSLKTGLILSGALLMLVLFMGCTSKLPVVDHIDTFSVDVEDDDYYKFSVSFYDKDENSITPPGTVTFSLKDSKGNVVYDTTRTIRSSDYSKSSFLTIKYYEYYMRISPSLMNTTAGGTGTAYMTFVSGDKTITAKEEYVSLPGKSYEFGSKSEEGYTPLKDVNLVVSKNNFKVTLKSIGTYTYETYSDGTKSNFAVYIDVQNIGNDVYSFYDSGSFAIINQRQYDSSYESEFDGSGLYPNAIKGGTLVFEDAPVDASGNIKIGLGDSYSNLEDIYVFDVNI